MAGERVRHGAEKKPEEGPVERLVSRLIPFALILLLLIIIGEFFFTELIEPYMREVEILDAAILVVFAADLYFKYMHLHNFKKFVRANWLEIIAIFPFYYVFRSAQETLLFVTGLREMQGIMHETLGIGAYVGRLLTELEKFARLGRSETFLRLLRPAARAPRFAKAVNLDFLKQAGKKLRR